MAIDKYLRWFIKYQALMIASITMFMAIMHLPFVVLFKGHDSDNNRFRGIIVFMFGLSWLLVAVFLILAIHKEQKRLIYPYAILFVAELVLLMLREIYIVVTKGFYVHIFTFKFILALLIVPYVMACLAALHRLFTVDPIFPRRNEGFVRFDRNEDTGVQTSTAATV